MQVFEDKIDAVKKEFHSKLTAEERWTRVIAWGKRAPPFPDVWKSEANLVPGCQSLLYLHTELQPTGVMTFSTYSEALISAGLAALLTYVYSGETPKHILLNPPIFLKETGILTSLSPSRSNGVMSLYQKMMSRSMA